MEQTINQEQGGIKNFIKKRKYWLLVAGALLLILAVSSIFVGQNEGNENEPSQEKVKVASLMVVGESNDDYYVKAVGQVEAENSVQITSLAKGTVQAVNFAMGDTVYAGEPLAVLYDSATLTNYNSALTAYNNSLNSLNNTKSMVEEGIRQAQIGVQNAQTSLASAQIAYEAAQSNYQTAKELQNKKNETTIKTAVVGYRGHLSSVDSALDKIDYILGADDENKQMQGVGSVLGVLNSTTVNQARQKFWQAKHKYNSMFGVEVNEYNVEQYMNEMVTLLDYTEQATHAMNEVLDNTVSTARFTETMLATQKMEFASLQNSLSASYNIVKATADSLSNMDFYNKQENTQLKTALDSAEKQVELAENGLENSQIALDNAQKSKDQQIIGAENGLNSAQTQMSLARTAMDNLTITSPISGEITFANVKVGEEINPGQRLAEVAQTGLVKITIDLATEDAYKLKQGQTVFIADSLNGVLANVSPVADAQSGKVKADIIYDNRNSDLIVGTNVKVSVVINPEDIKLEDPTVKIPLKAITMSPRENFVFVLTDDNRAKKRQVEVGEIFDNKVEIVSGLNEGEKLLVEGAKLLNDGDKVEIK